MESHRRHHRHPGWCKRIECVCIYVCIHVHIIIILFYTTCCSSDPDLQPFRFLPRRRGRRLSEIFRSARVCRHNIVEIITACYLTLTAARFLFLHIFFFFFFLSEGHQDF